MLKRNNLAMSKITEIRLRAFQREWLKVINFRGNYERLKLKLRSVNYGFELDTSIQTEWGRHSQKKNIITSLLTVQKAPEKKENCGEKWISNEFFPLSISALFNQTPHKNNFSVKLYFQISLLAECCSVSGKKRDFKSFFGLYCLSGNFPLYQKNESEQKTKIKNYTRGKELKALSRVKVIKYTLISGLEFTPFVQSNDVFPSQLRFW